MRTKKAPWDYERPAIIVNLLVKLCPNDGGYLFCTPKSPLVAACLICGGTDSVMVLQSDARAFRESLRVEVSNEFCCELES